MIRKDFQRISQVIELGIFGLDLSSTNPPSNTCSTDFAQAVNDPHQRQKKNAPEARVVYGGDVVMIKLNLKLYCKVVLTRIAEGSWCFETSPEPQVTFFVRNVETIIWPAS